jgi:hypothetical protein
MLNCMRTWSLRILRQSLRLALSALDLVAVAASAAFKSRAALQIFQCRSFTPRFPKTLDFG